MRTYPDNFEIEIDSEKLTRYWRTFGLTWLTLIACVVVLPWTLERSFETIGDAFGDGITVTPDLVLRIVALRATTGMAWAVGAAVAIYLVFVHFPSGWRARAAKLSVEGAYLRYRSGWLFRRDRRIHFRAISDYSCVDGPLMRLLKLRALSFTVVGAPNVMYSTIPAVVDAEDVRDMLCDVDAAREAG